MRIVGIDPGLHLTGYAVIDTGAGKPAIVDAGVIRLDQRQEMAARLVELDQELGEILTEHVPQACAVEQVYSHYAHPRTAILMAHARGVILLGAQRHGCRLFELPANRVKLAVSGHGHASKEQMQYAVQQIWQLAAPPDPPDVADALAIAYACALNLAGQRPSAER